MAVPSNESFKDFLKLLNSATAKNSGLFKRINKTLVDLVLGLIFNNVVISPSKENISRVLELIYNVAIIRKQPFHDHVVFHWLSNQENFKTALLTANLKLDYTKDEWIAARVIQVYKTIKPQPSNEDIDRQHESIKVMNATYIKTKDSSILPQTRDELVSWNMSEKAILARVNAKLYDISVEPLDFLLYQLVSAMYRYIYPPRPRNDAIDEKYTKSKRKSLTESAVKNIDKLIKYMDLDILFPDRIEFKTVNKEIGTGKRNDISALRASLTYYKEFLNRLMTHDVKPFSPTKFKAETDLEVERELIFSFWKCLKEMNAEKKSMAIASLLSIEGIELDKNTSDIGRMFNNWE